MSKQNRNYAETSRQFSQVWMLFLNRVDTIVLDKNIFHYYLQKSKELQKSNDPLAANVRHADFSKKVTIHQIFSPLNYRLLFKSKKIRDLFNKGIKKIIDDGTYRKIFSRYHLESYDQVMRSISND